MKSPRCLILAYSLLVAISLPLSMAESVPEDWATYELDTAATGEWWTINHEGQAAWCNLVHVERDRTVAFALYTTSRRTLKLTAQLYPLLPNEDRVVRLEVKRGENWIEIGREPVVYPGWSAHFRIEGWDDTEDVPYRVRHGEAASFEGLIRRDPREKNEIVVASLSCNSNRDRKERNIMVENIRRLNPDVLFFAGDQSYDHEEHTAGWLLWGEQFQEVIKDRPVITIPDDHDIGQYNLWGESGIRADSMAGDSGGYYFPASYVKMVERCQTWHLPDPFDPTPVEQGIGVYYTSCNVGGIDFAIIEDRKFKSGPKGKIPQQGPRPDHINDPKYDPTTIDLPGLNLLGDRQLHFLRQWGQDWTGAEMKCVLSQTNFAGAVTHHGKPDNYLHADLDSNGWPQTGRNEALAEIRRALACHLAGDQHLAVVTQHGIEEFRDGPFSFVNPAIFNNYYVRYWVPSTPPLTPFPNGNLKFTGDYFDGMGNRITMLAYANPPIPAANSRDDNRGDGFGIARFNKAARTTTFECWPKNSDVSKGDVDQYEGWPITVRMSDNDGRQPKAWLPTLKFVGVIDPVVQVVDQYSGEILYTRRIRGVTFTAPVYHSGMYTIKIGIDRADMLTLSSVASESIQGASEMVADLKRR